MIKEEGGVVRAQGQGTPSSLTARSGVVRRLTVRRQTRQHGRRLVVSLSVCLPVPRVSAQQLPPALELELDGEAADRSKCAGRGPWV